MIIKFLASPQVPANGGSNATADPQPHFINFDPANVPTESMDLLLEFMTVRENSFWVTPDPKRKKILAMDRYESVESLLHALQDIKENRANSRKRQTA